MTQPGIPTERSTSRVTQTVTSLLARTYATHAARPAIVAADGSAITFAELGGRARRLAGGLRRLGLAAADRIVVLMKNRPESFEIDHGLLAGSFIRVALSYRLHPLEVLRIARDCAATAIFVDAESAPGLLAALRHDGLRLTVISVDAPAVEAAIIDSLSEGVIPYTDLLEADEHEPAGADPEDICWLPYTSGTTGQPKGVMVSHRSLLACMRNLMVELPAIEPSDVLLHVAPLTHLSGYLGLTCLSRGASQVPMATFDPATTLRAIGEHGVTVLPIVPTMINALLPEAETGDYDLGSIHTVLYGGSAIAPDRLARAVKVFGDVFVQAYGLTEVAFPLTSLSKQGHRFAATGDVPERLASAGRVTPFVELRLVTPEGNEADAGELGEIWARGDIVMSGYWNRPEDTAAMISPDGWAATGDVGKMVDGYIYIVDRKKDMIVSGGFNIFPSEVENAISAIDGVDEVAVIGVPDEQWGEAVRAVVVLRPGADLTEADIAAGCKERIASYKKPQSVVFASEIPKTGTGKVRRRELRDEAWAGRDRRVGG